MLEKVLRHQFPWLCSGALSPYMHMCCRCITVMHHCYVGSHHLQSKFRHDCTSIVGNDCLKAATCAIASVCCEVDASCGATACTVDCSLERRGEGQKFVVAGVSMSRMPDEQDEVSHVLCACCFGATRHNPRFAITSARSNEHALAWAPANATTHLHGRAMHAQARLQRTPSCPLVCAMVGKCT